MCFAVKFNPLIGIKTNFMAKFSWKRKIGDKIAKQTPVQSVFEENDSSQVPLNDASLSKFKRRKAALSDNCILKSQELKAEGIKLAENGCYFDAVSLWDKALQLTPSDAKLYEMKAQALLQLNESMPALLAARKAVMLDPLWWIAHQTLGRCQLGVGEVKLAIISFSKAIHINPACQELWTDDLNWAVKILCEQKSLEEEEKAQEKCSDTHPESPCVLTNKSSLKDEIV